VAQPIFQRAAYSAIGAPGPAERVPALFFSSARGIQGLRNSYQQPLTILMTMVGVVLMIACGNVSMLIAARNAARQREFSLRTALGGSRARLFRQLVTESLALVGAGTVCGWLFAIASTRALAAWSSLDVSLAPDGGVLAFTLALSVVASLMFGLAPLVTAARPDWARAENIVGQHDRRSRRRAPVRRSSRRKSPFASSCWSAPACSSAPCRI